MAEVRGVAPPASDNWLEITGQALSLDQLATWPVLPFCGAVVMFAGTVRDHVEGRPPVVSLEYEAYVGPALRAITGIAMELRDRWPVIGRVALVHRTGLLLPTEVSVVVAVSAPHRDEAFKAARLGIDSLKSRVPIWKRESWEEGGDWGVGAQLLEAAPPR